jgi:MarR family transcriptional regulator, negative regulator of the multidrug operon emrRAB
MSLLELGSVAGSPGVLVGHAWHNTCMSHADERPRTANLLGSLSLAVADRMRAATEAAAGHAGSGPAALAALSTYLEGEPIDALGRSLGLTHSAAVRLVDRLEESGLVERRRGVDGRSVSVVMTATGRTAGREVLDARQRALDEVLESLSASERRALAGVCEKLLGGLTASRADAGRICRLCDPDACGHHDGRCPVTRAADRAGQYPEAVA